MPTEVVENTATGTIRLDRNFTKQTAQRRFTVRAFNADGTPNSEFLGRQAINAVGVSFGEAHPESTILTVNNVEVTREPNAPSTFRVTVSYGFGGTTGPSPGGSGGTGGGSGGVDDDFEQSVQLNYRGKFEKLWRVDANPNAEPYTGDGTGVDIGGTPMDTFGEIERTTLIVKPQLQVTMQRNVNIGSSRNYLTNLSILVGKRNKSEFLGAGKGRLLYVGATSRRVRGSLYEISHQFEYDKNQHAEQAPQPGVGPFGKKLGTSGEYKDRAFPVYWIQPYPETITFNSLGINLRG